jgi:uncharacterized protein (TIGR00369 family)
MSAGQKVGPDGLAQLQALMLVEPPSGIGATLQFRLAEVERGRVTLEGTPGAYAYNPLGTVHGGYAATLLDSACGLAVHSQLRPDQAYSTLELKVSYLKVITGQTGLVRAAGHTIQIGRTVAFAEASLTDSAGTLLASATSTLLILGR